MKIYVTNKTSDLFGEILKVEAGAAPHAQESWYIKAGEWDGHYILRSDCVEVDCPTCGNTDAEGLCAKGKTFCSTPEYQAWKPIVQADEKACPEKKDNRCNIDGHVCVDNSLCNMPKNADGDAAIPIPVTGQLKISSAEDKDRITQLEEAHLDLYNKLEELYSILGILEDAGAGMSLNHSDAVERLKKWESDINNMEKELATKDQQIAVLNEEIANTNGAMEDQYYELHNKIDDREARLDGLHKILEKLGESL